MIGLEAILVLTLVLAYQVSLFICRRAETLRLMQTPNHRSSHVQPTPNGGGLGIVVAGSLAGVSLVLLSGWALGGFVLGLGLAALLAAVGLRNDIQHLPARARFGVQVAVCAGVLIALGDLPRFTFSAGLEIEVSGWVLSGLLLLAGVWWINQFNFMDGIDGIAGAQAVFTVHVAGWCRFSGVGKCRCDLQPSLDVDVVRCSGNCGLSSAQLAARQNLHGRCG